jgi:fibronectin-binding autotransporter adhesin
MSLFSPIVAAPTSVFRGLQVVVLVTMALLASLSAADRTWDGGGGDDNWTTPANWDSDTAPIAGDNLFFAGGVSTSPVNNFPADTSFNNITFNAGASAFTLTSAGNRITLAGNVTNSSSNPQTINLAMVMAVTRTFDTTGASMAIGGELSGAGGLTKSGANTLTLSTATNTYAGGTTITAGTLQIGTGVFGTENEAALGTGTVTINTGGILRLEPGSTANAYNFANSFALNGGTIIGGDGNQHFATGGGATFAVGAAGGALQCAWTTRDLYIDGIMTGSGPLAVSPFGEPAALGGGLWIWNSANTYSGTITLTSTAVTNFSLLVTQPNALQFATLALVSGGNAPIVWITSENATTTIAGLSGTGIVQSGWNAGTYTLNVNTAASATFAGVLQNNSDVLAVTKNGSGTWTLTGTNTYTGATTVSAGTLSIGNGVTDGSIASSSGITNNAALIYNLVGSQTYGNVISGTGTLTKSGAGTLTLSGTNTYAGGTIITAGTLSYSADTVLSGTGAIQLNGGKLYHDSPSTLANAISVTASSTIESSDGDDIEFTSGTISATPGTLLSLVNTANAGIHSVSFSGSGFTYAGNMTMDSNSRILLTNTSGTQTFSGVISGSGTATDGAIRRNAAGGTTILSGTNTYTGVTTITAGTLSIGDGTTDGSIATSSGVTNNAALIYNLVGSRTYSNVISGSGTLTKTGAGTLTLSGVNTYTGTTTISAGTLQIGNGTTDGSIATSSGITNNAALVCLVVGANSYANVISGSGTLTKSGTGTLTLSGTNTYTGATTVSAGELMVIGSTDAGSAVTISSGATLSGDGTVAGTVAIANGGTLAPGKSLEASFFATSLRAVTENDWRATQTITGTRHDQLINQATNLFGTAAERAAYGIGGGDTGAGWENFSVQWDGFLRVTNAGTTLYTRSDDSSRVWLDLNSDGVVDGSEWGSNGWGSGQAEITRAVHAGLAIGLYRMRVQYEEGNGSNAIYLLWNDSSNSAGSVGSQYVVPASHLNSGLGTLTTGAVTFSATSAYSVDLNGATPTAEQISTTGAVTCAGTLTIGSVTNAALNNVYTIVSAGSRSGTFTGLAHGDLLEQQGRTFQIAYTGTTVTLTEVAHPTTRIWDGGGTDDNWTTAANWDFDILPVAGDHLVFAGTTRLTPNNDFPAETTFASITFNSGAGPFVIGPTTSTSGVISREVWTGVGGTNVASIPVGTAANITDSLTSLEGPSNYLDNYGTRIRGFITAPTTGNYIFWISSDDNSEMWLSTDVQPGNKILVGSVSDYTGIREWNKYPSQQSSPIALVAGQKYYIEVLHKEGGAGDSLAVGWAKPGEATTAPSEVIPGAYLSPYIGNSGITLAGNITNNSASLQTVNLGLYLAGARSVACTSGNVSLGGAISGVGGLTKAGTNALTLGGANTFSGGVSLNAGTLNLNNATALGTGAFTVAGGTIIDNTSGSAITMSANNPQTWNGDFTFTGTNALHLGDGAVAMGAATRQVTVSASTLTLGGAIGGAGGLTKQGNGTLRLAGVSTYAGATDVVAGTLALGVPMVSGFGTNGTGWSLNGGSAVASDVLTLTSNANDQGRSAFLTTRVPLGGFTTSFRYQAAGNRAADGTFFVLHNDTRGASALGGTGGTMAYGGITPSAAVAFNIFTSNVRGTGYRTGGTVSPPFTSTAPVDLGNGNVIAVNLKYDGTNLLTETLRDMTTGDTWSTTFTVGNLATTAGGASAYIGFTAATGGQVSTQQISNFNFNAGGGNLLPTTTDLSIAAGATVDLGGKDQQVASLANYGGGGGSVTNNGSEDSSLTVSGSGSTTYSGVLSDGSASRISLVKDGSSTLTLSGTNTFTGVTTVSAGTLLVTGNSSAAVGAVSVANAATIGGSGSLGGAITLGAGGILAPGTGGTTINTLTTGAVTGNATSVYLVDLDGAGPTADRVTSSGVVTCAGTLTIASIANATAGRTYTIASGTSVSGTFSGLGNGAVFTQQSRDFQISYTSTAVTLTDVTGVMPSTKTWDGGGSDDNWTTAANWVGDFAPLAGDSLVFTGGVRLAPNNTFPAATSFAAISFDNNADLFVIGGNPITLAGDITNNDTQVQTINLAVAMAATRTVNAASGDVVLGGVVSGAGGLTKTGAGTVTLTATNTFTGAVTITAGTLAVGNGTTDGSIATSSNIINNAALIYNLVGSNTYAKVISGTGTLTKIGSGTLTLSGTLANTYSGLTAITGGTLILQKTEGVSAIVGDITLGDTSGADVLRLGASNQIADTAIITFTSGGGGNSAKFELNGYLETVAGLQSNANQASVIQDTESGGPAGPNTPAILTVINAADVVFDGLIRNNNGGSGSLGLTKAGAGTLTLRCGFSSAAITYSGATTLSAGKVVVDNLSVFDSAITNNSAAADALTFNQTTQNLAYAAVISGTGAMSKTGSGMLTLSGAAANTYSGLTTVSAGRLHLSKTAGVDAIPGNVTNAGGQITMSGALLNQIADTAVFTQSGAASVMNGTAYNTNYFGLGETVADVLLSGGLMQTGINTPRATVTVTGSMTVQGGAGNTRFIANSATLVTTPSLSLSGMTGLTENDNNGFSLSGNNATATEVRIGAGGLTLDGSRINLRLGTSAGNDGSKLVLDGDVTTTGTAASTIRRDTNGATNGSVRVELGSTAGAATRTFTVGGSGADLTVSIPVMDGAATPGGITKAGNGTLTLSGTNAYTGATAVNAGVLSITGDSSAATGAVTVASGATLVGTGTIGGAVTVASGGTLSPGVSSDATVTISKASATALTLQAGSTLAMTLGTASDRVTCSGASSAIVLGGTLAVTCGSGFTNTSYVLASGTGTISGSFSSITFSLPGYAATVVLDNASATRTATLVVTNFAVTDRQTIDNDANGKIDRIRIVTGAANLSDGFGGITVTVAGYTVTGYNTGAVANDGTFDVLVTELGSADTSATPLVQVTVNTSLQSQGTTSYLPVEGSATAATDTAAPVLLSSSWTDGDANGVDAGDTVTLTFSESVVTTAMVVADLGLPVTGDSFAASTIANQTATTITVTLVGIPLLTPGGVYSSGAITAGNPSGIYLADNTHVVDQATAPNNAAVGSPTSAVDLGPGTARVLSAAWVTEVDPKTWALSTIAYSATRNTVTDGRDLRIRNAGDGAVQMVISTAASTPSGWAPDTAAGTNLYLMKCDNTGASAGGPTDAANYALTLTTTPQTLAARTYSGGIADFELWFQAPSAITVGGGLSQAITVTITIQLTP